MLKLSFGIYTGKTCVLKFCIMLLARFKTNCEEKKNSINN